MSVVVEKIDIEKPLAVSEIANVELETIEVELIKENIPVDIQKVKQKKKKKKKKACK